MASLCAAPSSHGPHITWPPSHGPRPPASPLPQWAGPDLGCQTLRTLACQRQCKRMLAATQHIYQRQLQMPEAPQRAKGMWLPCSQTVPSPKHRLGHPLPPLPPPPLPLPLLLLPPGAPFNPTYCARSCAQATTIPADPATPCLLPIDLRPTCHDQAGPLPFHKTNRISKESNPKPLNWTYLRARRSARLRRRKRGPAAAGWLLRACGLASELCSMRMMTCAHVRRMRQA